MSYWIQISLPTPDTLGASQLAAVLPAKLFLKSSQISELSCDPCIPVNCCTTCEQLVVPVAKCVMCVYSETEVPYFFNQTPQVLFYSLLVLARLYSSATAIRGWHLFHLEAGR